MPAIPVAIPVAVPGTGAGASATSPPIRRCATRRTNEAKELVSNDATAGAGRGWAEHVLPRRSLEDDSGEPDDQAVVASIERGERGVDPSAERRKPFVQGSTWRVSAPVMS